jgi:predicted ATP-grasp superfamily ATP-dependent carboligase
MKVLVTGVTWSAGLAVVHSLARAGHQIIGVDTRKLAFRIQSRFVHRSYCLPQQEKTYISALMHVIRTEKPDLLLPVNNSRFICRSRRELFSMVPMLVPEWPSYEAAYDNLHTVLECRRLGIAAPRILTMDEVLKMQGEARETTAALAVLKPRADVGGARGLRFIHNGGSAEAVRREVEAVYGPAFFQEYIPGRGAMRTVNLLFDRNSLPVASFTMTKLRQWPVTGGVTVLGVSTRDEELVAKALPLFKRWKWQGPAEVELKIDARDGQAKIIEINPRFPRYIGFLIQCGLDFPRMICRLMETKAPVYHQAQEYTVGAKYIEVPGYLKAVWQEMVHHRAPHRVLKRVRTDLKGKLFTNHGQWRDWPALMAKAMTRYRPTGDRSAIDVRY